MLKQLLAILILGVVLLQTFSKMIIVADYYVNQEYIAKNLCENKDKPQMNCNGKCHLKKQLNKDEKQKQSLPFQNLKDKNDAQFFFEKNLFAFLFHSENTILNSFYYSPITTSHLHAVFHPPKR